ncbi:MAG TPA: DUF6508 domain-containing protein [Candidatus Limnocylindrales bacterium]|nr:DUF6508 domain-containing protein [Candidatus Limnocylindrales bacterium]
MIRVEWLEPVDFGAGRAAWQDARIGMTSLPGTRAADWAASPRHEPAGSPAHELAADLDILRDVHRCDVLLVLVEDRELEHLGVDGLADAAAARAIELLRHPIRDGAVPADPAALRGTLDAVEARLRVGASVVVACRGGFGRTGLVVACLLRELSGLDGPAAVSVVRLRRPGAVETAEQASFVAAWTWPDRAEAYDRPLVDRLRELGDLEEALAAATDTDFGTWSTPAPKGDVSYLPQYAFGPVGKAFLAVVGRGGWVFPFDWGAWLATPEGAALQGGEAAEAVARATPLQLARLLTAIVRSDRFVEGSVAGAFESGLLLGIARRAGGLANRGSLE